MKWAAALLGSVLLLARLVAAQPEILHPPGSAAPVEGLPILLEFGGTGSNDDAFTSGECVEVFTDPVCVGGTNAGGACVGASACPGGTCGLKKLRSAGDACGTGSGTPGPIVTPFACATGYAVQVVGATPGCVLLPTPDGAGAGAAATQTPWSCGAGNGARGMGGTPECFVVPTPDGSVATVTPGGGTPQPIATSTSAPGSAAGFARVDHVHHIADGAIGAAKLAFTVPTPDGTPNPGDVTAVGSCTDGACLTDGKATSGSTLVVWEGSTVDGNQLTINAGSSDPAAAHILVVPDTDGILVATVDGAEQDPQVGTRTSGAYCKGDGSAVQCTTTTVELASGGTGAALTDPNADRIMFWDDSAGATAYLEPSTGLAIQGTAIVAVTPVYYATPTPVPTPGSDPALAAGQCAWALGYDGLVCEGSTANTIETHLVAANPTTSDKTITLPDATGTVALLEQSQTFTGVNTFTNDVVIGGGTQTTLQQVTVQSGYDFYFTDGSGNGAQFTAASDLFAPYGTGTVRANDVSCASAPCVTLSSEVTGTLPLANGGTGAALTDPNADRIMFWDDSAGATAYLAPSTGLAIQGTAIVAVTPAYYVTPTPIATPGSNPTMAAGQAYWADGYAGIVSEGATADTIEGRLAFPDWQSSDKTLTFPDETGTICTTGSVCSGYFGTGDTVQPTQLNRLAANNQMRYFGSSDPVFLQYDSTANALQMAGRLMITGPTATAPAATATATVVVTPTPTNIPTATSATATPTPTATSNTPTPTVSPTPGRIENVGVQLNGKLWSPDDGSAGFEVVTSVAASGGLGFNTTTQYTGVGASGFQSTTTETVAPSYAPAAMKCDRLRACFITSNLAINERMRVVLRTGRTINNMADTLLTCTADGNSSQTDGCSGAGSNSGKRGCTVTLPYPVAIREGFARTLSFQCNGAQCGIASTGAIVSLWCWPDNR